jgi:signal transduction histidine kinase
MDETLLANQQAYVERFTLIYCAVVMSFSAYFTPQDFNWKVALPVNLLLFLIGAPYWFRKSQIPKTTLSVASQVSNALASVWICSFLGPTSHANLVAIPQFILVLMMFKGRSRTLTYLLGSVCVFLLSLPLFSFVNTWYAHKRMPEEDLVVLRYLLDLSILALTTYQVHVITHSWQGALKDVEQKRMHLERESIWRARLIRILSHDIKEPIVGALQMVRKLRKNPELDRQSSLINQLENSQMMIREIISNVETYSATSEDLDLPTQSLSFPEVLDKLSPWIRSRIEEKRVTLGLDRVSKLHTLQANPESLSYQVVLNLLSNAIKFSPEGSRVELETRSSGGNIEWIIRDQGKGISDEAFAREGLSESGTSGESGSGLGIRIARLMAERQGITVKWMRGTPTGTTVILTQPVSITKD